MTEQTKLDAKKIKRAFGRIVSATAIQDKQGIASAWNDLIDLFNSPKQHVARVLKLTPAELTNFSKGNRLPTTNKFSTMATALSEYTGIEIDYVKLYKVALNDVDGIKNIQPLKIAHSSSLCSVSELIEIANSLSANDEVTYISEESDEVKVGAKVNCADLQLYQRVSAFANKLGTMSSLFGTITVTQEGINIVPKAKGIEPSQQ